jgi:hypothetical protein
MFYPSIASIVAVLLFKNACNALIVPRIPIPSTHISANSVSASELVEKALDALGGEQALRKLEGVTYHAPRYHQTTKPS